MKTLQVEISHSASFPVKYARFTRGVYISAKGQLIAGCHTVEYAEIRHCAGLLGLEVQA